ncbi:CAAX amino terminal protease self-immunity [Chlamydia trachomatis]|nr:CAAX amino terminal protease self-immunity [Chlamydia trachomatis]
MISVQIVYTFFMGIVVAIVYSKTRNLIYPIIIHIVNNLLSAITGLLPNPIIEKTIDIATLVMIIPTIYFLIKLGKQKQTI